MSTKNPSSPSQNEEEPPLPLVGVRRQMPSLNKQASEGLFRPKAPPSRPSAAPQPKQEVINTTATDEEVEVQRESVRDTAAEPALPDGLPRQWLFDRIYGKSKLGRGRPPLACCWVPPPVGFCPNIMEESRFCKIWGRIGLIDPHNDRARFWTILVGFIANFLGFWLILYSAFAISTNYDILRATSYSRTLITNLAGEALENTIQADVGLRAAAIDVPARAEKLVVEFGEFCSLPSESVVSFVADEETAGQQCSACAEVSSGMVISVIMSVVTFIPTFSTNVLRMYANYDVNCQKGFATIFASLSLILSLNTLRKYNQSCFRSFYEGVIPLDSNFDVTTDEASIVYNVQIEWQGGPGLACLYIGTILKAIDIAFNMLVPSPSITRNDKEKWEYEHLTGRTEHDDEGKNEGDQQTRANGPDV